MMRNKDVFYFFVRSGSEQDPPPLFAVVGDIYLKYN